MPGILVGKRFTLQFRRRLGAWLASAASTGLLACPTMGLAQSVPTVSRAVVQGLPSAESQRLNAALARIARDPRDFAALIDAGDAANAMGDPEAAAGFYKRADGIVPNNARIKAGMARALVLQGKPTEAIPLFAAAEAGGAAGDVTSDRGLAYDLVGDPVTAQRYYRAALARRDEDEVRRRLGISLAITGDAAGSDAMLMPLLRKQDKPAWRAHAFALAIAGKTKDAVATVNAILPVPLAQSVTPYLRYMPRLTRAQQAAAVNLGQFPRASEIGRDDPLIAAYAPAVAHVASADAGLIPRGKPLGGGRSRSAATDPMAAAPLSGSERRARDKAARLAQAEAVRAARVAPPEPQPAIDRDGDGELPALGTSAPMAPAGALAGVATRTPTLAGRPSLASATPSSARPAYTSASPSARVAATPQAPMTRTIEATSTPTAQMASARSAGPAVVHTGSIALPSLASAGTTPRPSSPATSAAAPPSAMIARTPSSTAAAGPTPNTASPVRNAAPGFDLANLGASNEPPTTPPITPAPPALAASPAAAPQATATAAPSLEQAFADLGAPSRAPAPIAGAVDVMAIEPAKPAPPPEPVKDEPAPTPPTKVETARFAAGKGSRVKGTAQPAELDTAPSGKKKAAKGTKLAEADADMGVDDEKLTGSKKGDPKKTDKKSDAKKADAKKPPSHPSRIWVQVGVGRDPAAIAYDWRKFVKDSPALFKGRQPYVSDMGRTNRVLAGPFETQKAASELLAKLKKADVGSAFIWTSPAGQVVDPLSVK